MKRQDYVIFFLLIALLFAWPGIYQKFFADKNPPVAELATNVVAEATADVESAAEEVSSEEITTADPDSETVTEPAVGDTEEVETAEEQQVELASASVKLLVSSRGASVMSATLLNYREALPKDSGPVVFDFSGRPALAYSGIPGLTEKNDFTIRDVTGDSATLERTEGGIALRRVITVGENYLVTVADTFINKSAEPYDIGQHLIRSGTIPQENAHSELVGMINMGVDSWSSAGGVQNYGKAIPGRFNTARDEAGSTILPEEITFKPSAKPVPADWVAAKNKYFVQILMPEGEGADWIEIYARRESDNILHHGKKSKDAVVDGVAASLGFNGQTLAPGESYTRTFEYYIGPKNYGILSKLSHEREGAMGFEENAYLDFVVVPTAKLLLRLLNWIHDHVMANYGVAIILPTLIVKIVFWPITHKSTESMRRMASVQPLMAEVREKYKDNPQKMQQAMMALYKEHKINPLGGCLPMFVQIPVFFALFVVLRIAIELRFAEFLWISDLSAPERLLEFGFVLPLLGWDALNILPLLMTITMIIQMKLSPSAGDPQQQKIMMFMMPAMMLFFLYNFASGLALYWTTQNVLMILQQLIYQQRKKHQPALAAAK